VASWALAEELLDVLRRPKLRKYRIVAQDFGDLLAILAPFLPSVEVQLRDPDDVPAVAAAVAGRAGAIVTGDNDLPVRATSDRPAWSAHAP